MTDSTTDVVVLAARLETAEQECDRLRASLDMRKRLAVEAEQAFFRLVAEVTGKDAVPGDYDAAHAEARAALGRLRADQLSALSQSAGEYEKEFKQP